MSEPIEMLGYAKTDRNDKVYYFVRSAEQDKVVNLKDFVIFVHPFTTASEKDKVRVIFRPAANKETK